MSIKIYSCEGSRGMRPMWTLEEMKVDFQAEMLPFPPRVFSPEYLEVNSLGTIPYLEDGKVRMTESVGMCQYFVEKYGPTDLQVLPNEDDFAAYLNWLTHSDATLTFPQTVVLRYTLQEPGVADAAAEGYRKWFVSRLKLLEKTLEDREYLCCDRLTIADICVSYAIYLASSLGIDQAFKPNIKRWTDMLFEREAFKKAKSYRHQEKNPVIK
ncbi:MAG: glutathione S-transferase family protein [SAR86 cluster bacterium]|nr:glutathione S-transferase family protein [SAR86 cluster bacterium]|tara:strand:- start:2107 stop:2742 length:636 start_codon:yes stop_codon:yes gene_type:complete